jgi:hypothetical protein
LREAGIFPRNKSRRDVNPWPRAAKTSLDGNMKGWLIQKYWAYNE